MANESGGQFEDLSPFYDELMSGVPYASWVDYVELLWEIHGSSPLRVLDAACGTGNVSLELSRRGYDVVGVDLSSSMVASARAKASAQVLEASPRGRGRASFEVGDLRSFSLQGLEAPFEAATCLYDSLNYILEPEDLRMAFSRVAAHVQRGGLWAFDMNAPWAFEADLFTQSSHDPRKDLSYSWQASFDRATRVCTVQMLFEKGRGAQGTLRFRETHRERAYELQEVEELLQGAGWELEAAYDAYTLNPPRKKSERWYFVARKR